MTELFDSLAGRTHFTGHFCPLFNFILQQTGSNYSDVISSEFLGTVIADKHVKFGGPRLNLSREISLGAVWGGIFGGFSRQRPTGISK